MCWEDAYITEEIQKVTENVKQMKTNDTGFEITGVQI